MALTGNVTTVPLFTGFGLHYAWMYVGTPPQRVSVAISTRSSVMALPCSSMSNTTAPFSAANSSTYSQVDCGVASSFFQCKRCESAVSGCEISQTYVDGSSYSVQIAEDLLFLAGDDKNGASGFSSNKEMQSKFGTSFMFGCRFKETGLFTAGGIDGLLGLSNNDNTLVTKLYDANKIPEKLFSLCLTPTGGSLTLGAIDTSRHNSEIMYAKLAPDPLNTNFFNIKLTDLQIGNESIQAPQVSYTHGHFTVDSGTTYTYLPISMQRSFLQTFQQATGLAYEPSGDEFSQTCSGYSEQQMKLFPAIRFVLEAAESDGESLVLKLTPQQYLIQENNKRFCGGLYFTEDYGGILGANVMMHRDVVFDSSNDRIGFADANCTFQAFETPSTSGSTASSSSRAFGNPSTGSSFVNSSHDGNGTAGSGSTDSQLASTAFKASHLPAFLIGVGFIVFVVMVMAILLRRRGRKARARRLSHYGGRDGRQVRLFSDGDDEDFEAGAPSIYDDSSAPKESFVTPHFLIHSPPPALIVRSPRNQQVLEHEDEWAYEHSRRGRAHTLIFTFDRRTCEPPSRGSGPQRVEL